MLPGEATGLGLVPLGTGTVSVRDRYGVVLASHGSEAMEQDECRGTQQLESSY